MKITEEKFIKDYQDRMMAMYSMAIPEASKGQQYRVLASVVRDYYAKNWQQTRTKYEKQDRKQIYYFSIEFLPGRFLTQNMLNLGITDVVLSGLQKLGLKYSEIAGREPDPGLGNGGLGRLGSAFLDSAASEGVALNGNSIRYQYGLFKQDFVNGYQVELPDDWLRNGNAWEVRKENRACVVHFGGNVWLKEDSLGHLRAVYEHTNDVIAVPYDIGIVGYKNNVVNTMRLWSAELPFNADQRYTLAEKQQVNDITEVLYPDDSNYEGRLLRLKQEYFFVSAGIQSIVRAYRKTHRNFNEFSQKVGIHINDTHPAMAVAELMRILMDEEFLGWDRAWNITTQVMSYTNHTLLAEALETWPEDMFAKTVPRIYQIIQEIDHRFRQKMVPIHGAELVSSVAPIQDGQVRMAYLAVIGSHSVNGVAKLHTELLQSSVLNGLYQIYPEKFNNKTNGVTMRRWLLVANPRLSHLLNEAIGTDWQRHPDALRAFKVLTQDKTILQKLGDVKHKNKRELATQIQEQLGIKVNTHALFDVQIKRLHAYKRQLLHALYIIDEYLQIKDGKKLTVPRVHIFAAKAAPSYYYAKEIIKLINALADLVNHDPEVGNQLKIVFIPNYGVSIAEKIIPAADVSEQISLAGKEASGTSNMKLMANGAVTLATLDGANIEIKDAVGADNIVTFGMTVDEVEKFNFYQSAQIYKTNARIHRILDTLVDGTIPNITTEGRDIFNSLVQYNDQYFVLADYDSYAQAQEKISQLYQDRYDWYQISAQNIAASGRFASDYTIQRYAEDIWHVKIEAPAE
ncbi:glycogen/starch/alpha-glucan phosphorylase [Lactobacillus sp. CC-MHH1034]|uniref:glycogen/starch/alpha-glucan phosphorylase n=1 Tax=Agrilactobacillus fermenti TaxID=2586909 RepID=UPI001E45CFB3|nr:glycogen/starch/alpha-glucan phosphorylase [Agrilactobacillus fermenti]MCD2255487.1 glycogen/starch/alpha-glucan phosphorylase [Agrilactobacillus fermenti]